MARNNTTVHNAYLVEEIVGSMNFFGCGVKTFNILYMVYLCLNLQ